MNDGQSNHGFLWLLQNEQKWRSVFAASSDYSVPAKRPKLVVTYAPMKKYFYLKDHPARAGQVLGNIRVTVDENGDVKGYNDYYPFGLRMPGRSMNTALNYALYKYSSKELDEENGINWYYFGARYYDPEVGRWGSIDPLTHIYPGHSPYNYVSNNPIINIDTNGESWYTYLEVYEEEEEYIDEDGTIKKRKVTKSRRRFQWVDDDKNDFVITTSEIVNKTQRKER